MSPVASFRTLLGTFALSGLLIFAGCSGHPYQASVRPAVAGISGQVHGGQQPVVGATIQLYTVGTSGVGSASTPLLTQTVTTDAGGNFSIANLFSCTDATLVYITATGGNPGVSSNNPNIALMTALGPCSSLGSNIQFISINELTTVAAVAALAPFMQSPTAIGSGALNVSTLTAAFTLAAQLVDPSQGMSPGLNIPAGQLAPVNEINTLGNIIASCVNSVGGAAGDSSSCGQLFLLTTPPGGTPPTDTIAALQVLALNPALNTSQLFVLSTSSGPFQPQLTVAPSNFRIQLVPAGLTVLQISPSSLSFPTTAVGFPATALPIMIRNSGSTSVAISSIAITGANAADFAQTNNCVSSLFPSGTCTVQVTATPSATGTRNASLVITSNSPDSPQFAALSVVGEAPGAGPVTISPTTLSYTLGGTVQDVTLSNLGSTPLAIKSITETDTNSPPRPAFSIVGNNCGTSLPAQSVCTISVASLLTQLNSTEQPFVYTGTLTVVDDAETGPQTAALTSANTGLFQGTTVNGVVSFPANQNGYQQTVTGVLYESPSYYTTAPPVSLALAGQDPGDFSDTVAQVGPSEPGCNPSISGNPCLLFTFNFTPTAAGIRTAKAIINQGNQYLLLTGTGVGPGPSFTLGSPSISLSSALPSAPDPHGNDSASVPLTITNTGTTTFSFSASFSGANASLMTVSAGNCTSVAPQASCTATVGFNSATVGTFTASLTVKDANSTFSRSIPITANASYWPVAVSPSFLQFDLQALNTTSAAKTFTLGDLNGYPLGHALTVALASPSNFVLTQGSTCPASLTQACTLAVAFSPIQAGNISEFALITDQVSGYTTKLQLIGSAGSSAVSLSSSFLQFPLRATGTTSIPMSVIVTNTGVANLIISSIGLQGAINGNFTQTNNCTAATIPVNGTCTINVTFAPTATGMQTGQINILSNTLSGMDFIALSGTAN